MIIKNVKPTTTVEMILKALDPFAYLDERNVRLVKAKPPGARCFCFVDMDSHEVPKTILCSMNLVHFHRLSEDFVIVFVQYFPHRDCCVFLCSKWHDWLSSSLNLDPFILMESEFMLKLQSPSRTKGKFLFAEDFLTTTPPPTDLFLIVLFPVQFQKRHRQTKRFYPRVSTWGRHGGGKLWSFPLFL